MYTLQTGLNLGIPYGVANYPANLNPAADGLRNITGQVNSDGTVSIWGITSTVSASGDQGADPNQLLMVTDSLSNTDSSVAAGEQFTLLRTAGYGEVLRGVSFTPGTIKTVTPNVQGNLTVDAGQVVHLSHGSVTGNVKVNGGTLILGNGTQLTGNLQVSSGMVFGSDSNIGGNVEFNGGGSFSLEPGTVVNGNLQIQNLPAGDWLDTVCGARIGGNVEFHNNSAAAAIGSNSGCAGNAIGGNLQIHNNSAPVDVFGNHVTGNLQCDQNSAIDGGANTASMKQGQCTSF